MKRVRQSSKREGIPCSGEISVQEVGGKALQISDKFVLILHVFSINMHKHGNDQERTYQF